MAHANHYHRPSCKNYRAKGSESDKYQEKCTECKKLNSEKKQDQLKVPCEPPEELIEGVYPPEPFDIVVGNRNY